MLARGVVLLVICAPSVAANPGLSVDDNASYVKVEGPVAMDDGGEAWPTTLEYAWRIVEVDGTSVRVRVTATIRVDQVVGYLGSSVSNMAKAGNYSFVKRFDAGDISGGRVYVRDGYVELRGPRELSVTEEIVVDAAGLAVGRDGVPFRWVLWMDPNTIPLSGKAVVQRWTPPGMDPIYADVFVEEGFSSGMVAAHVREFRPGLGEWIRSSTAPVSFLNGAPEAKRSQHLLLQDIYDPKSGILLGSVGGSYVDDFLTTRLGLVATHEPLRLESTTVPLAPTTPTQEIPGPHLLVLVLGVALAGRRWRR